MTTKSQLYINCCSISSRKVLFDHVDTLAQLKEGPCFRRNLFVVAVVIVVFFFQWTCVRCCKRNLQQVHFRFCPACWDKNKVAPSSLMAYHNHSKHGIMLLSNRDDILRTQHTKSSNNLWNFRNTRNRCSFQDNLPPKRFVQMAVFCYVNHLHDFGKVRILWIRTWAFVSRPPA